MIFLWSVSFEMPNRLSGTALPIPQLLSLFPVLLVQPQLRGSCLLGRIKCLPLLQSCSEDGGNRLGPGVYGMCLGPELLNRAPRGSWGPLAPEHLQR